MKFWITLCTIVVSTMLMQHPANAGDDAGVRHFPAPSTERGADLDVTVWYPAQPGGEPVNLGDSKLFVGTSAMRDAPMSGGKFPLILLSHGAGMAGNPQALSWIATPLARQGFIVAAPTHPGNTGPNKSAAETMNSGCAPPISRQRWTRSARTPSSPITSSKAKSAFSAFPWAATRHWR
jgi:predicted dienelactone hydrolase